MHQRLASVLVSSAVLATATSAHAFGGWMAQASSFPVEERVAVAVTPSRTTLWTSVRYQGVASAAALVLPVAPGSAAAVTSDAWFEALEAATAPRIFPPQGQSATCPGAQLFSVPFETVGHVEHVQSAAVLESAILPDVASVTAWAAARQLVMTPSLAQGLGQLAGVQFLVVRFDAVEGGGLTPTIRVAAPGSSPTLPLALTAAQGADVLVSTWLLGSGTGQLTGATTQVMSDADLFWNAASQTSNYATERLELDDSPADAWLEATTHGGIVAETPIGGEPVAIDGFLATYFERGVAYEGGLLDPDACVALATPAFSSTATVASLCPRAELGVVGAPPACPETVPPGTLDPAALRCGPGIDDLAVALAGAAPAGTWLTRQTLVIPNLQHGADWPLTFAAEPPLVPAWITPFVDDSNCPPTSSSGEGRRARRHVGREPRERQRVRREPRSLGRRRRDLQRGRHQLRRLRRIERRQRRQRRRVQRRRRRRGVAAAATPATSAAWATSARARPAASARRASRW